MKAYFKTDIGKTREKNEDSIYFDNNGNYIIAIVADGMGGHKSGEIASKLAIESAGDYFTKYINKFIDSPKEFLLELFYHSCKVVHDESEKSADLEGMGTTMTLAIINTSTKKAYIGNIGDSRTYAIKNKRIIQITEDHTLVNQMYKNGQISFEEIKTHPQKNVLTRALGTCEKTEPDIFEENLNEIEGLILCSDGLTNYISKKEILDFIILYKDKAIDELIKEAKNRGGTDNISIIIISNIIEV